MRQLNLQLYGRTAQKGFNEDLSIRKTVTLDLAPTTIELPLKAPRREKFVELRLDPDDKPSTFTLHDLRIRLAGGAEICRWDGSPESLSGLINLRAWAANDGVLMESVGNDPFLLIPLPEPQAETLVLELSISQARSPVVRADGTVEPIEIQQQELADAVRSLQVNLRFALDDLAAEQEGLQDALVLQQAHNRAFTAELADSAKNVRKAILSDLNAVEDTLRSELTIKTKDVRNEILAAVRDDWRSLRNQIEARAEAASKEAQDREEARAAVQEAELAKLMAMMRRFAVADEEMRQVRAELGVANHDDAIASLKELKTEAQNAQSRIAALERSLCWRLMKFAGWKAS